MFSVPHSLCNLTHESPLLIFPNLPITSFIDKMVNSPVTRRYLEGLVMSLNLMEEIILMMLKNSPGAVAVLEPPQSEDAAAPGGAGW